jgi:tagatose 1,6-diphosphate aldolase
MPFRRIADPIKSISDGKGRFRVLAVDHGESFRRRLLEARHRIPTDKDVVEVKIDIMRVLAGVADAVVVDPGPVLKEAVRERVIPVGTGLIAGLPELEVGGVRHTGKARTAILDAANLGCDAVKLCFQIEKSDDLHQFVTFATKTAAWCHKSSMALIVEVVTPQASLSRRGVCAVRANGSAIFARVFAELDVDLLKLEFPKCGAHSSPEEQLEACSEVSEASRHVPWVLLSSGANFEMFEHQVDIACRGGAAGYIAGTSIWQEVIDNENGASRRGFLKSTGLERMSRLSARVLTSGVSPSSTNCVTDLRLRGIE